MTRIIVAILLFLVAVMIAGTRSPSAQTTAPVPVTTPQPARYTVIDYMIRQDALERRVAALEERCPSP